jgi:hypothetical protein
MYNRYIGNTGKYYKVDDALAAPERAPASASQTARRGHAVAASPAYIAHASGRGTLQSMLGALLPAGLDVDIGDIILLLLLVLLYIDSGDYEFLVILGFMVFAMFKKRPE